MDSQSIQDQESLSGFNARDFLFKYLKFLPWLILSPLIFLALAYVKLRYSPVIYQVESKLLIKEGQGQGGSEDKLASLFRSNESQNLNDEIEIIKSSGISKRVVKNLGLQVAYTSIGNVKTYVLHPLESPFWLEMLNLKDSMQGFSIQINIIDDRTVNIGESKTAVYFGQTFENESGKFRLLRRPINYHQYGSSLYVISYTPLDDIARSLASGFNVNQITDFSNVLQVLYETENPRLGRDIVNQLMNEYNISNVEDKRIITVNTLQFIDESIDTLSRELTQVEQKLQNYQEGNKAVNLVQQSAMNFSELTLLNQSLTEQEINLKVIDYLTVYMNDESKLFKTVPTTLGITEPSLQVLIGQYNQAQLKRDVQAKNTPAENPIIKDLDAESAKLREQIRESLVNVRQSYVINRDNLLKKSRASESEIGSVPGKDRRLLEITRQQKILGDLYSFLLQKKLETSISSASTISNSKILEPARSSYTPVKPNRSGSFLLALLLGLALPVGIIALREALNDKIRSRADVERLTQAPILGEIGHSDTTETLVVTENNRKFISEQFRIIRTNLQYILNKVEKPVILVTSSFSGEGKSFVSTNIGAVLALTGKKTVILEFDIRKPKIIAGLDLAKNAGITNYIIGNAAIEDIVIPVRQVDNLFVIPCGPIPPNPAELLLDDKVKSLFEFARNKFDVVIIDSAPVGLVSDAIILSAFADATLYIMRQEYTLKKQLHLINEFYLKNKLPKLSLLLNDIKATGGYYGGYYGGSYGYGYSYGSGGYFEQEKKKQKGLLSRLKKMFGK